MITFKAENGMCPYFMYDGTLYYILEEKNRSSWIDGDHTYELRSRKQMVKVTEYKTAKEIDEVIKGIGAYLYITHFADRAYKKGQKLYCVSGLTITERYDYESLSGQFETYAECLEFSKKYIQNIIDEIEGKQTKLFEEGK